MKIIQTGTLPYDILLVIDGERYIALWLKCTHVGNPLTVNRTRLTCNLHGSTFDLRGRVTKGPATESLQRFKTGKDDKYINIYLS